jgi:hypothetical protein
LKEREVRRFDVGPFVNRTDNITDDGTKHGFLLD